MKCKSFDDPGLPGEEDVIFVRPGLERWDGILEANRRGIIKGERRRELLEVAADYTEFIGGKKLDTEKADVVVGTGHQPVWHHCGILAKSVVASEYAYRRGGIAVQLVLDHDVINMDINAPNIEGGEKRFRIEGGCGTRGAEFRGAPQRAFAEELLREVCELRADSILAEVCNVCELARFSEEEAESLSDFITALQAKLYSALGIEVLYLPVSRMAKSLGFMEFAGEIIFRAFEFSEAYNCGVRRGCNSPRELYIDKSRGVTELPFWLVCRRGTRHSMYVVEQGEGEIVVVRADAEIGVIRGRDVGEVGKQLGDILAQSGFCLRPKAVTLTLFARLYLADIFVHGVGADAYEGVTDWILGEFYGRRESRYVKATATVRLRRDGESGRRDYFFGLFETERLLEIFGRGDF